MAIFSFFSGVGMLDLGFQEAGYEVVFVNEFKEDFLRSYIYARRNRYPQLPRFGYHLGDINIFLQGREQEDLHISINELRNEGEVIGFIGGPPCPDFSIGGRNEGRNGVNGKLAQSYIDMIIKFKPDFFLFENVKGLVRTQIHREYFDELKVQLQEAGYSISDCLLNALSFGVPQDRDRILMIGILQESVLANEEVRNNVEFHFPWEEGLPFVATDIKNLQWPERQAFRENSRRNFHYNVPQNLTVEYWFRQNNVINHPNQNDVFRVRSGLQKMMEIHEGDTSRKSYKRLHRWRYSPTAAYGNNEVHLHPYQVRRLSVAEAMAIQSLPQWFELPQNISLSSKFKMVGNGVPYLMANQIAIKLLNYFYRI